MHQRKLIVSSVPKSATQSNPISVKPPCILPVPEPSNMSVLESSDSSVPNPIALYSAPVPIQSVKPASVQFPTVYTQNHITEPTNRQTGSVLPLVTYQSIDVPYYARLSDIPKIDFTSTVVISSLLASTIATDTFFAQSSFQYFAEFEDIVTSTAFVYALYVDNQEITANPTELLLNGVPLATLSNLSSIADWSFDPAINDVNMNGYNLLSTNSVVTSNLQSYAVNSVSGQFSTLNSETGLFSSLTVENLTVNSTIQNYFVLSTVNVYANLVLTDYISSTGGFVGQLQVSSINGLEISSFINPEAVSSFNELSVDQFSVSSINGVSFSNLVLNISSLNAGQFSSLFTSTLDADIAEIRTLITDVGSFSTLSAGSGFVTNFTACNINGSPYDSVANWANYTAVSNVNLGNHGINAQGSLTGYPNSQLDTNLYIGKASYVLAPDVIIYPTYFQIGDSGTAARKISMTSELSIDIGAINGVNITGGTGLSLFGGGGITAVGATITLGAGLLTMLGGQILLGSGNLTIGSGAVEIGTGTILIGTAGTAGGGINNFGGSIDSSPSVLGGNGGFRARGGANMEVEGAGLLMTNTLTSGNLGYLNIAGQTIGSNTVQVNNVKQITSELGTQGMKILGIDYIDFERPGGGALIGVSTINGIPVSAYENISSISSLNEWSLYPAISAVNMNGNNLIDAYTVSSLFVESGSVTASLISSMAVQVSSINGLSIDTYANISSISTASEWAYYPALSTIQFAPGVPAVIQASNLQLTGTVVASTLSTAIIKGANDAIYGFPFPGIAIEAGTIWLSTTQTIGGGNFNGSTCAFFQGRIRDVQASTMTTSNLSFTGTQSYGLSSILNLTSSVITGAGSSSVLNANTDLSVGQNLIWARQMRLGYNNTNDNVSEVLMYGGNGDYRVFKSGAGDTTVRVGTVTSGTNTGYLFDTLLNPLFFSTINQSTAMMCTFPSSISGSRGISTLSVIPPIQFYCSAFSSTSQTVVGANTVTLGTHNAVAINTGGFVVSGSTITVPAPGTYEITTSIQFATSSGGTNKAKFWFRKNGVDLAQSASIVSIVNNGDTLGNVSILEQLAAGDAITIAFASDDGNMTASAVAATTSPYVSPAIPSFITNVRRIGS